MWLTAAAIVALTVAVVVALWWAATSGLNGADLVTARLDALKIGLSIGVGSGGIVALYLSWRRQRSAEADLDNRERALAHQQHDAAERRLTELYLKAVEQLGSPQAAVRHGGLYALERVAQDNPSQRQTVVNVICAYLRNPYTPPPEKHMSRPLGVRRPLLKTTDSSRTPANSPHSGSRENQLQEREVRLTAQRILHQHMQPGSDPEHPRPDFWPNIDIDLAGATLIDFSLANCRIDNASFKNAAFVGTAWFGWAQFLGDALFDRVEFGDARFVGVKIRGEAGFVGATFGRAVFSRAEFGGVAWFDRAEFGGVARFDGAEFGENARFDGAEFGDDVWFDGATFRHAVFNRAEFGGVARFVEAEFGGEAGFAGATFRHAMFDWAEFGSDARFVNAKFGISVSFDRAEFGGNASFDDAVHDGRIFDPAEHGVPQRAGQPDSAGDPDPV